MLLTWALKRGNHQPAGLSEEIDGLHSDREAKYKDLKITRFPNAVYYYYRM